MKPKLKIPDRESPMLLPPDLRDWIPEKHIVHFLIEAVDRLPETDFRFNWKGTGSDQYSPRMMLTLLIYCYISGRFSSREIEEASYSDVIVRYICGGDLHPDHDTICSFRRKNKTLFNEAFVKVLMMAAEMGCVKKVGTVSVDGTKIKANASRHSAVSYAGAARQLDALKKEVAELEAKAEEADSTPLEDGLSLPEEIERRTDRIAKLDAARDAIKERYEQEQLADKQAEYEAKKADRDAQRAEGKKPRGKEPKPPAPTPPGKAQINFTDPESRIMKSGNGYEQCFNAQAGVDTESMLIIEEYVTEHANDKKELEEHIERFDSEVYTPDSVLADTGYFKEDLEEIEQAGGPKLYVATGRCPHGRTVAELEQREDPPAPGPETPFKERMKHRLKTGEGKALYRLRKQTVEPVFGIIKSAMGFRRMSMRGKEKAETEWTLVCLSYNLKRLFNLSGGVCPQRA